MSENPVPVDEGTIPPSSALPLLRGALDLVKIAKPIIAAGESFSAEESTILRVEVELASIIKGLLERDCLQGEGQAARCAELPTVGGAPSTTVDDLDDGENGRNGLALDSIQEEKSSEISSACSSSSSVSRSTVIVEPTTLKNAPEKDKKEPPNLIEARARTAFMILDADRTGELERSELLQSMEMIGVAEAQRESAMNAMLEKVDVDGDGKVSLDEFIQLLTAEYPEDEMMQYVQHAFTDWVLSYEFTHRKLDMIKGDDKWIMDPRNKFASNWDIFVGLLLIVMVVTMPLSMAFPEIQQALQPLDLIGDVAFILDIIKQFNTGYLDEFDFAIMDRAKAQHNYMTSWFLPDALSSIPLEIIGLFLGEESSGDGGGSTEDLRATKALKLLRLARIAKIFRVMKLSKLAGMFQKMQDDFEDHFEVHVDDATLAMFRLAAMLFILSHWIGCLQFMICREYNFPPESWVGFADLEYASPGTQYAWSFYKALAQMIQIGFDKPPIINTTCEVRTEWCTIEHWITLLCLYIGSVFYALIISSVSFVMANMNVGGFNLSEELLKVSDYLKSRKVSPTLKHKIRGFFRVHFADGKLYDEPDILKTLPPDLRDEVHYFNKRELFETVPLLARFELGLEGNKSVHRFAAAMTFRLALKGEVIVQEDTVGREIFFVSSGLVEIFTKHRAFMVKALADGCYFGEVACLLGCKRTATVRSKTVATLSVLAQEDLSELLADVPAFDRHMTRIAQLRMERIKAFASSPGSHSLIDMRDDEDSATKYFLKLDAGRASSSSSRQASPHPITTQDSVLLLNEAILPSSAPPSNKPSRSNSLDFQPPRENRKERAIGTSLP